MSNVNQVTDCTTYCQIAFVIDMGYGVVVTVAAQNQHGQVVRANGVTINKFVELVSQNDVGRNFSHQPNFEVLTTFQTTLSHDISNLFAFLYIAAERNHYVQVFQAKLFTNFANSQAFQFECFNVFRIIVTGSAAPAEECGRFIGFELIAALKITIFRRFEVRETQGYRTRCHSLANLTHTFSQLVNYFFRMAGFDQIQRMFMDISSPDELFTHQANAVAGQVSIFFSQLRVTQVHVNLGAGGREVFSNSNLLLSLFFFGLFDDAFIYYAMSSVNSYIDAVLDSSGSSFATALSTYDTGDAQLAANDRSMAGHSAAVGYDSFSFLHSRYPVRSGHFGY